MQCKNACSLFLAYRDLLTHHILTEKVELNRIPFEVRKYSRHFYIAGNRVTRHNKEKHIAYAKLILSDYAQMTPTEKPILRELVEQIEEWEPDAFKKAVLQISKEKNRIPLVLNIPQNNTESLWDLHGFTITDTDEADTKRIELLL